jgi:HAD superfamily hydrolase (TIGR01457 family)
MVASLQALTTYLIDLDGVIYRGEELVTGAREFVAWLDANKKKYLFLTNNSFASEQQVVQKLTRLGIPTDASHVMGAAQAAVQYIQRHLPDAQVYIVGEEPLFDLVRSYELHIANPDWQSANAVFVGLDRTFNYEKLTGAVLAAKNGAAFIAINRDPVLPIAGGNVIAGCGTMVAAIEAGSEVTPVVIGKPEPTLLQEAMQKLGSTQEETVMIGDTISVDIQAGKAAGTHTLLVLSGKDTPTSLAKSVIKPDYVYENLGTVLLQLH